MLTNDPSLVSLSATLLLKVLQYNDDALSTLYTTGVFFFALLYCGSNLGELAALLHVSHLRQHFRGLPEAVQAVQPMSERSYLGLMLPGSLLYMLESYGPERFAGVHGGPRGWWWWV